MLCAGEGGLPATARAADPEHATSPTASPRPADVQGVAWTDAAAMEVHAEGTPAATAAAEAGSEAPVAQQGGRAASEQPPPTRREGSPLQGPSGAPDHDGPPSGAQAPAPAAPSTDGAAAAGGNAQDAAPLLGTQVKMILDLPQFLSCVVIKGCQCFLSGGCASILHVGDRCQSEKHGLRQ